MIQFSYTTNKPAELFTVTYTNSNKQDRQSVEEKRSIKSNKKRSAKKSINKKNYSISISNDYSYVPFVPAYDFFNNKVREDGSYGTHLYRDCFGRFYDNCCYDNMD